MTSSDAQSIVLNADQEHSGLRAGVMATVLIAFSLTFLIVNAILSGPLFEGQFVSTYAFAVTCILALLIALAVAGAGESIMKRYWTSGRRVVLNDSSLEATLPKGKHARIDWSARVWAIRWYFSLKGYPRGGRERRLSAKHLCLACQLQQDEVKLIVYGYMKEKEAEALLNGGEFQRISPADYYERRRLPVRQSTDRPKIPVDVLAGKDGPYWLAEQRRWSEGIELTAKDFAVFYEAVRERVEE
ncbi:MAG: hypothetical protein JSW55_15240 [Chloroflexota bacterium]|nr:MAG: hypothetical protein JSW55_15240 [Chloroflexota bacterium]